MCSLPHADHIHILFSMNNGRLVSTGDGLDRGIMRHVIRYLVSGSHFGGGDEGGHVKWIYLPDGATMGDLDHEYMVKAIGSLLAFHLLWYGTGCLPVSVWVIHLIVAREDSAYSLSLDEVTELDGPTGSLLAKWPATRPAALSQDASTLCVEYLNIAVRSSFLLLLVLNTDLSGNSRRGRETSTILRMTGPQNG